MITRGQAHYESGEAEKAITDFDAVLQLDPKNAEALRSRGRAYYNKDQSEKALTDLNEAIRLDPKDSESLVARGLGVLRTGRPGKGDR